MPQDLTARVEATCLRLGLSPEAAKAIAARAVTWAETGKTRHTTADLRVAIKAASRSDTTGPLRVFGWASTVDDGTAIVVDHDGDVIPAAELERASSKGLALPLDVDHQRREIGRITESLWIDPAKRLSLGVSPEGPSGWWIGAEVTDPETIARVDSGELRELSMRFGRTRTVLAPEAAKALGADETRGLAVLTDLEIRDVSLVPAGAGRGVEIRETRKAGGGQMTPDEMLAAIAALPPEQRAALMSAIQAKFGEPAEPPEAPKMDPEKEQAKAREEAMKADIHNLQEQIKRRDLVDSLKTRGFGDGIPGASLTEVADLLSGASPALRPVLDRVVAASAEQAKALATRAGLTGAGPTGGTDFDSLYEAAKARDPKADPSALIEQIKTTNPAAYAARYARS